MTKSSQKTSRIDSQGPNQDSAAISIGCRRNTRANDGDQPTVVQAQLVAWSQADNDDLLEQTTDILASYVVELDDRGELQSYQRVNRYYRNAASGGDE